MKSTQGVLESCFSLFYEIEGDVDTRGLFHDKGTIPLGDRQQVGALYVIYLTESINDYIKRPGMIEEGLFISPTRSRRTGITRLTPASIRKYAAMETADFAKVIYDIATNKGKNTIPVPDEKSPDFFERCLYAAYVYTQVAEFLERRNETFTHVPMNSGIIAIAQINTAEPVIDSKTMEGTITIGDVTFEAVTEVITNEETGEKTVKTKKISTAAMMLNDFFLSESHRTGSASIAVPLRELAIKKKRSTSKQSILKLRDEVLQQMDEIKEHGKFNCKERINGKKKPSGRIEINGGTAFIAGGVIYWNFNQDLFDQLSLTAPTDYPVELWSVDPRTNQYFFGRYIAINRRLNEGKPGRDRIPIKTLISKTQNLPSYEEVMKGSRHVSDRIIKKTFADLDALEFVYYDVYTNDGKLVENPEKMDYQTFINAYILLDYSDFPEHPTRIKKRQERQKKIKEAKEKRQIEAAAKN